MPITSLPYGGREQRTFLILLAALLSVASANTYAPPRLLLVGLDFGDYGFKFLPRGVNASNARARECWGELVQLQADGSLKSLWKHRLVNVPSRILISPSGHVVTLDSWAGAGSPAHAVVIYSPSGRIVADLSFSQVITRPGACPACMSMDGPFLSGQYRPKFNMYGDGWFLVLRNTGGQGPTISLTTGQFKTSWNGQAR